MPDNTLDEFLVQVFTDRYRWEAERQARFETQLNLPVGLATILASSALVLFQQWIRLFQPILDWRSWIITGLLALLVGVAVTVWATAWGIGPAMYHLWRAYKSRHYLTTATPSTLYEYAQGLLAHYRSRGEPQADSIAKREFQQHLVAELQEVAEHNAGINTERFADLYRAKSAIMKSIVGLSIGAGILVLLLFANEIQNVVS